MTRPSQSLWLRSGSNTVTSGRREPVRATVFPVARGVDHTPSRTVVGPSGPVRPSAVEQVRAADAADTAHRCDEPWCREVVARAGTLCPVHHALRMRRPALARLQLVATRRAADLREPARSVALSTVERRTAGALADVLAVALAAGIERAPVKEGA